MSYKIIIIIIFVLLLLITAFYINFFVIPSRSDSEKKPTTFCEKNTAIHPAPSKKEKPLSLFPELPQLNASDDFMRENLKQYSNQPLFQKWLTHQDIIRRLVAIVDSIARGDIPSPSITFLNPDKPFKIIKKANHITMDPENHNRYALLINIFVSIDTGSIMDLFHKIHPLLDEAYRELGYPEKKFKTTLMQAIQVVLNTPIIQSPVFLEQQVITYSFKDSGLEKLLPAQKQISRTGPENTRKIQEKCREIYTRLNSENH